MIRYLSCAGSELDLLLSSVVAVTVPILELNRLEYLDAEHIRGKHGARQIVYQRPAP